MATNFPASVDSLTNPVSNDSLNSPSHSAQHTNANDAIEAIETSLLPAGVNYSGMVHVNTTSFTTQTTVSVNNVFTSSFVNYFVVTNIFGSGTNAAVAFRFRASGTDLSTGAYTAADITITNAGTLTGGGSSSQTSIAEWTRVFAASDVVSTQTAFISQPQLPKRKYITREAVFNNGVSTVRQSSGFEINSIVAQDGFSLIASSGNLSGTIYVYGLRNS
jgi:hypothetical protein